jgi:hypothetical protein
VNLIEIFIPDSKWRVFRDENYENLYVLQYDGYKKLQFDSTHHDHAWLYQLPCGTTRDASVDLMRGDIIDE